MKTSDAETSPLVELDSLNRELASLFACDPVRLAGGSEAALRDDLVLCGVLGGKNVGKSTLINALARRRVSVDRDAEITGTDRPVVYVHADVRHEAADRLHTIASIRELEFVTHQADDVRNLVLVDLPDFDSEFRGHVDMVRQIAPLLDRIIWVATPRKLGDRAWLEMVRGVIKHARNVHCVLNKVDELLTDADPFGDAPDEDDQAFPSKAGRNGSVAARFFDRYDGWLARVSAAAGCVHEPDHRFLIAAAFADETAFARQVARQWDDPDWNRYAKERATVSEVGRMVSDSLDRLRSTVLTPLPTDTVRAIKQANQRRELVVLTERLRVHFDLDRTLASLRELCSTTQADQYLRGAFDEEARSALTSEVARTMRGERALADELLERRVDAWPLLRVVHWPLGWLARAVGRRINIARSLVGAGEYDSAIANGWDHVDRIESMQARLLGDAGAMLDRLRIEREIPSARSLDRRLGQGLRDLPRAWEASMLDELWTRHRRPSMLGRSVLWLVTLWFPFLQPIAAGLLEMYVETGTVHLAHGAYRLVTALSAAHLLAGFGVVAGIYVAILAAMYTRSLRAVRCRLDEEFSQGGLEDRIDELVVRTVLGPMLAPFVRRLEQLSMIEARLKVVTAQARAA